MPIRKYSDFFKNTICQLEQKNISTRVVKPPRFPMLFIFKGENVIQQYNEFFLNLCLVFSETFVNDMEFISINEDGNIKDLKTNEYSDNFDLLDVTDRLLDIHNKFAKKDRILIYYMMNSNDSNNIETIKDEMSAILEIKQNLGIPSYQIHDIFLLELDEKPRNQEFAAQIHDFFRNAYSETKLDRDIVNADSFFIFSNKVNGGGFINSWDEIIHIMSLVVLLSNDENYKEIIFNKKCNCVGYSRIEKPIEAISEISVKNFINTISCPPFINNDDKEIMTVENKFEQLCKYFDTFVYKYINDNFDNYISLENGLQYLPLSNIVDYDSRENVSYDDLNTMTMDCLQLYLEDQYAKIVNKIIHDDQLFMSFINEFDHKIKELFTIKELKILKNYNTSSNNYIFNSLKFETTNSKKNIVKEYVKREIVNQIVLNSNLKENLVKILIAQMDTAKEFSDSWDKLVASSNEIYVDTPSIKDFYNHVIDDYIRRNMDKITKTFNNVNNSSELEEFITSTLQDIISSTSIYTASFDKELTDRMSYNSSEIFSKQNIIRILTENKNVYFDSLSPLSNPILSEVFIDENNGICETLKANNHSCYDIGRNNIAESLDIYDLTATNF